jgi:dienelactone hydrolase
MLKQTLRPSQPKLTLTAVIMFCVGLCTGNPAAADSEAYAFLEDHAPFTGLYRWDDEFIAIGQIPEAEVFYMQRLKTGDMRFLNKTGADQWAYSPTRNVSDLIEGRIDFKKRQNGERYFRWEDMDHVPREADRVPVDRIPFEISTPEGVTLSGELITPDRNAISPVLVLVPQSNRYNIFDVGMWALSRGIGIAIYDQRNSPSGRSLGPEPAGIYQEQMSIYAQDAITVIDYVMGHESVDASKVAVAGWSGGGFTAAFVASERPELAGYLNIAGDASFGFEQASHLYISRLYREGFSDEEIAAAREFVDAHFGVASGQVEWSNYQAHIGRVQETAWYSYLSNRYAVPYLNAERVTEIGEQQSQWPPSRVYGQVTKVPTMGVFFEWDHSSAPSAPQNFLTALRDAGNGDVHITIVPESNHGGFIVGEDEYRFDTSRLTGRSPILVETVADWLENKLRDDAN